MLTLDSNLAAVLYRMERRPVAVRTAIQRTLNQAAWQERLLREAERTLTALAPPEKGAAVKALLGTLTTLVRQAEGAWELLASMRNPWYQFKMPWPTQPEGGGPRVKLGEGFRYENLLADIYDWVRDKKDWKTERDGERNTANIAEKADAFAYLFTHPDPSKEMQDASKKVLPHIVEYLAGQQAASSPSPVPHETVAEWLGAVLTAWRALVERELAPEFIRHYLAAQGELV